MESTEDLGRKLANQMIAADSEKKLAAALRAVDSAKQSRLAWIACLLVVGALGGAWFGGHQGRAGYALGYEAGRLSTAEGRADAAEKQSDDETHFTCDANGRNCVAK